MLNRAWNFAEIFSAIAGDRPGAAALQDVRGPLSWADFDRRTDAFARELVAAGLARQAKVAVYQRSGREFLETYLACMKAGLVPVNVNVRYGPAELTYLFDDADIEAVVAHREFLPQIAQLRPALPGLGPVYAVDDAPDAARPATDRQAGTNGADGTDRGYEEAIAARMADGASALEDRRGPDDLLLMYTGGTTGRPKGVMWRQNDLFEALVVSGQQALDLPPVRSIADLLAGLPQTPPRGLAASPLMHSTGLLNQFMSLLAGGCAVQLPGRRFDPQVLWRTVEGCGVTSLAIVGDAFARPMLAALDARPEAYDLRSLKLIVSSGAMWSRSVQEGLLRHLPAVTLYDALGSSEGFGLGMSSMSATGSRDTGHFRPGPNVRVLTDDGHWLAPGETGLGRAAVFGALPLGYYKDDARSATAFPTVDGVRYSVAGDYVRVLADGSMHLLGRGSACINTGGEKVFAEEVEEILKEHAEVVDAACVGLPDARLGTRVCAVVEPAPGARPTAAGLIEHVRSRLAGYKVPRQVILVADLPRTALGKVDYPAATALAVAAPLPERSAG